MKKQINLLYMEYYVETSQYFTDKKTLNKSEIHSPYKPNLITFSVHLYHFKPAENLDYFKVLMNTTSNLCNSNPQGDSKFVRITLVFEL